MLAGGAAVVILSMVLRNALREQRAQAA
jgi:hypothetical protein